MEGRVTSTVAQGRAATVRASQQLGPDQGDATGRSVVTKADKGIAPAVSGAAPVVTPISPSSGIALVDAPEHAQVRGTLSEYLDNTMEAGLRQRVEKHLGACHDCSAFLETLRGTVGVLQGLPTPKAPPERIARILDQARELARQEAADSADA
jgi:hypothetical protein